MKGFGTMVRERRREFGMNQADLASMLRVSASHIARIEIGKRKPSNKLLGEMAGVLEIPYEEMAEMGLPGSFYRAAKAQTESDKALLALSPKVKRLLLEFGIVLEKSLE